MIPGLGLGLGLGLRPGSATHPVAPRLPDITTPRPRPASPVPGYPAGPFPALQLAALLLARQSVPLSPAHAGRMKEN